MDDLSVCQEYLLCSLNEKGNLPALSTEVPVCLLAGGLIDLLFSKSIAINEKKQFHIIGDLKSENQHLQSLYEFINEAKPMKVDQLVSQYAFTFTDKRLKLLIKDIGSSLVDKSYATADTKGFFGNSVSFIPNVEAIDRVIQSIRAELLEDGVLSEDMIALVSLLEKSNQIKRYFSKYEKEQLKLRLNEIKKDPSNKLVKEMIDYIEMMMVLIAIV